MKKIIKIKIDSCFLYVKDNGVLTENKSEAKVFENENEMTIFACETRARLPIWNIVSFEDVV